MRNLFLLICGHLTFMHFCGAEPNIPQDRSWELWEEDDVSQLIHEYWVNDPMEMQHRKALAELVNKLYKPGEKFLEAGCGSGLVYQALVPAVMDNAFYTGVDITEKMLEIAYKNHPKGLFIKDDLYALSFADATQDMVAAFEVLGHLGEIVVPIREMCRVASRLVLFTVWVGDQTILTKEHFRNATFLHVTYSHAQIMDAIRQAASGDFHIEVIPLNGNVYAYVIHLQLLR